MTPRLQLLEGREVPAVFTVTTASDSSFDSGFTLREAIAAANAATGPDSIEFSLPANSKIILDPNALDSFSMPQGALPTITEELAITGPGKATLAVGGAGLVRLFRTADNVPLTISGLTLQGGNASDGFDGGAILAKGPLTLTDTTLRSNQASVSFSGGAIFSTSTVKLDNVLFDSNQAGITGGAIAFRNLTNSSVTITNAIGPVIFLNNKAGLEGGAIFLADADFTATGVEFASNSASQRGGALMSGSSLVPGGAIAIDTATFDGNTSGGGGGAATFYDVTGTISQSTFSNNADTSDFASGGALDVQQVTVSTPLLTVTNSTFADNTGRAGGAIGITTESSNAPVLALSHVTITNNRAGTGGGIRNGSGTAAVSLFNTIVAGNFDAMGLVPDDINGRILSLGTNLFSTTVGTLGVDPSDLVFTNPMLGSLANNGGLTQTVLPLADSPALGVANPIGSISIDQRGQPRPSGGVFDIGAVQLQRPTAIDDTFSVDGVMATNVPAPGVLGNDKANDINPGLTSFLLTAPPVTFGGVNLLDDGSFTFTPASGASGSATFTYFVTDGLTKSSATVTLNIPAVPPTANDDSFALPNIPPNSSTVIAPGVLGNDTLGSNPGPLTATIVSQPPATFGTVSLAGDGSFVFTPAVGAFGSGTFTYFANDGMSQSATATVTLTLPFVPPTANDDSFALPNVPPGTSTVIAPGVLGNDVQNDAFPITAQLVSQPAATFGTVSLSANGSFIFNPAAGAFGSGSFTYQASDGKTQSTTATVTLTLPFVPPTAKDDSFALPNIPPGTSTVIAPGVLGNDIQNDAFPLTAVLVSQPSSAFGSVSLSADGSFVFTPAVGAFGSGTFIYRASDGKSSSLSAVVTLTLPFVPPTANDDVFALPNIPPGTSTVIAPGVLGNDVQNDAFPITAQLVSQPAVTFGSVSLSANGSFIFTPAAGAFGSGSFTYQASDGKSQSTPATVTLTLPFVPPTANDDSFALPNIPPGTSTVIAPGVLGNDIPNDGFPLTAQLVSQPSSAFGSVSLAADGSFVFTPATGAFGSGSFTYQASDGKSQSTTATVTLTLPFVPPTANDDSFALPNIPPGTSTVIAPGVLGNDVQNDAFPITAQLVSQPAATFGSVSLSADGSFVFTPAVGAFGSGSFTYRASDGKSQSTPATVTLTLPFVPPTANDDAFTVANPTPNQSTVVAPGVLANDKLNDGFSPLSAVIVQQPATTFGTVALNADGSFVFTPAIGATGTGTFTYRASDGISTSAVATVSLTIPVAVPVVNLTAVGAGAGVEPRVRVFNTDGSVRFNFLAFEPSFLGGVRVAVGDATGDGTADIFAVAGTGGGPRVAVFDGLTGARIADFFTFEPEFRGGLHVAAADTDGDGKVEVVVGAGSTPTFSGGPRVSAINPLTLTRTADFFAFDESFRGGVRVAAADLDSDGVAEIVAVAGPSGGPHVRVFTGAGADRGSFFAFDQAYRGGAFLAASAGRIFVAPDSVPTSAGTVYGDFFDSFPDTGGSLPQGATGTNVSRRPQVFVFDAASGSPAQTPSQIVDLFEPTFLGGVRISVGESNGQTGLYAAAGSGGNGRVRFFPLGNALATNPLFEFTGLDNLGTASVYVGSAAKDGHAN